MEELFECEICCEPMDDIYQIVSLDVKNEACSHSFCYKCLEGIVLKAQKDGIKPLCPKCYREIITFTKNLIAMQIKEEFLNHIKKRESEVNKEREEEKKLIEKLEKELKDQKDKFNSITTNSSDKIKNLEKKLKAHLVSEEEAKILQKQLDEERHKVLKEEIRVKQLVDQIENVKNDSNQKIQELEKEKNVLAKKLEIEKIKVDKGQEKIIEKPIVHPNTVPPISPTYFPIFRQWRGKIVIPPSSFKLMEGRGSRKKTLVKRAKKVNSEDIFVIKIQNINFAYVDIPKQKSNDNADPNNEKSADGSDLEYNRSYGFYSSFRESLLLRKLNHCCIPKLQNVIRDNNFIKKADPYYCLVLPYKGKDAGFLEVSTQDQNLSLESIQQIFYRILGALNYLHSADIVHRDIKPTSIMVEFDRQGKQVNGASLVSFGQARSLRKPWGKIEESKKQTVQSSVLEQWGFYLSKSPKTEVKTAKDVQGIGVFNQPLFPKLPERNYNLCYWAPELAILEEHRHVTPNFDWKKCDIWSLACSIAEMLRLGEPLFTAHTSNDLLVQIMSINECRPNEDSFLDDKDFPIKSLSWPKEGKVSLKEALSQIPTFVLKPKFTSPLLACNSKILVDQCVDILSKMLSFNSYDRLTTGELLNHEFFADIKEPAVEMLCPPFKSEKLTDNYLVDFVIKYCGGPYTY